MRRSGQRSLLTIAALLLTLSAYVALFGGFSLLVLGVHFTSGDPFRALTAGTVIGAIGLVLSPFRFATNSADAERLGARCAAALAALTFVLGIVYGTFVAGAADAYGYVSQADLWATGHVVSDAPLAGDAGWPDAEWALTPLGYRPALERGRMVPVYPPGLPLVMALFERLAGVRAVYFVVPVLASLSVWLTYVLGRTLAGPAAGLLAAVALVSSPVFLLQLMVPMSDIPAMSFWLLATVLAIGAPASSSSPASMLASGAATALAIMVRPNLVVLAVPMMILVTIRGTSSSDRIRRVLLWALPAASGPLAVAIINTHLYGSPFSSGYDRLDNLYALRYAWPNLSRYSGWLVSTQTPFILAGVVAVPLFLKLRDRQRLSITVWALSFSACVALCYAWYLPFDNWSYLRFLLPAYPMLLVTASAAIVLAALRHTRGPGIILATGLVLVSWGLWQGRVAFGVREGEARYRVAGEMTRMLPANAVIISNLHSGSVRYYGNRLTVRYEWLGADEYEPAVRYLREHGHPVYVMLDDSELQAFRERYERLNDVSWLDEEPAAVAAGRVFLFALPSPQSLITNH